MTMTIAGYLSLIHNTLASPDKVRCYLCKLDVPHTENEHGEAVSNGIHRSAGKRSGSIDWSNPEQRRAYLDAERIRHRELRNLKKKAAA
jgi:hypothetical protein